MGSYRGAVAVAVMLALAGAAPASAQIKAGAAVVDASWHVGASAGQYATTRDETGLEQEFDPSVHSFKNSPSYGIQSRLSARAIVVQNGADKLALVKIDLYIPQDLLWRRTAQLLDAKNIGIDKQNLVMTITHDHSSPYYTSTAWGAWSFQDVFDIRAYDHYATRLAAAVEEANAHLVPVRVGAAVTKLAKTNRNALGPSVADDGTPSGFPDSYTDRDLTLVRFDDISSPNHPKPLANLVTWSKHPEDLNGNDLISADFVGPLQRMLDRSTGAVTVFTQSAVGNSEPERDSYHSIHERLQFSHKEYAQSEYDGAITAAALRKLWDEIGAGTPQTADPARFIRFFSEGPVKFADHWFPGPLTHPYPGVSNCRTQTTVDGDPQLPVVGLPDCQKISDALRDNGVPVPPNPLQHPGPSFYDLKKAGIPLPDNLSFPSYTGLEEDVSVHLQAFRIGDILFTVCSCEQWADQSRNIKTRTDRTSGDEWLGFDWASYRGLDDTHVECFEIPPYDGAHWSCPHPESALTTPCYRTAAGTWSCPNPSRECLLKGVAFSNTCRGTPFDARLEGITDEQFIRMRSEVRNCAEGWNSTEFAPYAESEPTDPALIKGNYTCDDGAKSAQYGYGLTVALSMANDYNGYIATFREYQRGDHYRKALTGWGPHSSDYMATRMVKLARSLNGGPPLDQTVDGEPDPDADNPLLEAKTIADQAHNDLRAQALGTGGELAVTGYSALLPDDGGSAGVVTQPTDIQRFDAALFTWNGGSNYTDNPVVRVQRKTSSGTWQDFADQSGEVPVTVKWPAFTDAPSYLTGGQRWEWTAHFEAFGSRYDLLAGTRATPAGTYRFVVDGRRRQGHAVTTYKVTSREFAVGDWSGVTAEDLKAEPDGRVSFRVGPRHSVPVPGGSPATATLGPIDYPDSYDKKPGRARFIRYERSVVRDPGAPADPSRFEWYCLTCSFRPWADTGDAVTAVVTFLRKNGHTVREDAHADGDRWVTDRMLGKDESAYVCPGDVRDEFGDFNGGPSTVAGVAAGLVCDDGKGKRARSRVVGAPNLGRGRVATAPCVPIAAGKRAALRKRGRAHVRVVFVRKRSSGRVVRVARVYRAC